jgi:ubiquinone/menaquinone biosynthesis C-methylase UbiE
MAKKITGFADTIQWYEDNAQMYAAASQGIPNPDLIERFVTYLKSGDKVLDAGCAAGRDSHLLNQKGLTVVGIDLSQNFIKLARENYPDITFRFGNFLDLPFSEHTFDGVWAHAAIVHLETKRDVIKALSEFFRVLQPGGILHLHVKRRMDDQVTSVISDPLSRHDRFFRWFTPKEVSAYLTQIGFSIIERNNRYIRPGSSRGIIWISTLARKTS